MTHNISLDGNSLTIDDVFGVSKNQTKVNLAPKSAKKLTSIRKLVENAAKKKKPLYGVNTGFGALSETSIPKKKLKTLQKNLILSHAVGVGDLLSLEESRSLMLLRANTLAKGYSGCRLKVVTTLLKLLNKNCTPWVPRKGSVGASGDLAPLAHLAMLLIGKGKAFVEKKETTAKIALKHAGLKPLKLKAKEGLALINGTQAMASIGCLLVKQATFLADLADMIGAMSVEALKGSDTPFDERIQAVRPQAGQATSARLLRKMLSKSQIRESHLDCTRVQDAYSLRCMPQVHGACRDSLHFVKNVIQTEINSATDNPLVFQESKKKISLLSGGNFHGQPLAFALDYLAIAVSELSNISERRMEQMLNPHLSNGLPAFLAPKPGINSGFMMLQVTAAALVNENKVLAHPASSDSIPTSASREDHVSMGMTSANKATIIVDNTVRVLSIELMLAAQGVDLRLPLKPGHGVKALLKACRKYFSFAGKDRSFAQDMEKAYAFCKSKKLEKLALTWSGK